MKLSKKLMGALQNLSVRELRELAQLAPRLQKIIRTLIVQKPDLVPRTCSEDETNAITAFIEKIGYEITPAQPSDSQFETMLAVPKSIEGLLRDLVPFAHLPLLDCLNKKAVPNDNLNEIDRWLCALNTLFTEKVKNNFTLYSPKFCTRFFSQLFAFTDIVGLDFSANAMQTLTTSQLDVSDLQSFLDESSKAYASIPGGSYATRESPDLIALLERNSSIYAPLLQVEADKGYEPSLSPSLETMSHPPLRRTLTV